METRTEERPELTPLSPREVQWLQGAHAEKKSWPTTRKDPTVEADGYQHYCSTCWPIETRWPCRVARLLAFAATPDTD